MLDDLIDESFSSKSYFSNPYPLFDTLRTQSPVFYSNQIGGWVLTKHEDVDAVLRNSEVFSSKGRITHLLNQLEPELQPELESLHFHFARGLAHSDAPEHRRLRGLLARAFTPKMIENLRPRIREIATEIISSLKTEADLLDDLLTPLPARVVGELLGSSTEDIPNLIRWAHAINGLYEKGGRISAEKALHAESMLKEMRSFVAKLILERQSKKKLGSLSGEEDVLSALVIQEENALTEDEMLSTMVSLFVAAVFAAVAAAVAAAAAVVAAATLTGSVSLAAKAAALAAFAAAVASAALVLASVAAAMAAACLTSTSASWTGVAGSVKAPTAAASSVCAVVAVAGLSMLFTTLAQGTQSQAVLQPFRASHLVMRSK